VKRTDFGMDGHCSNVQVRFDAGVPHVVMRHPSGQEVAVHAAVLVFAASCYHKAMAELAARGVQGLGRVQ